MFRVTVGSSLWGCAFGFTCKRRIVAFRKVKAAIAQIPDAKYRPTESELDAAYQSLGKWSRRMHGRSPHMSHEPGSRAWYLNIDRVS